MILHVMHLLVAMGSKLEEDGKGSGRRSFWHESTTRENRGVGSGTLSAADWTTRRNLGFAPIIGRQIDGAFPVIRMEDHPQNDSITWNNELNLRLAALSRRLYSLKPLCPLLSGNKMPEGFPTIIRRSKTYEPCSSDS